MRQRRFTNRRLATLHLLVGSALVILACLATGWSLYDAREGQLREAEHQAAAVASTLVRSIERTAATLDLSLQSAIKGLAIPDLADLPAVTRQAVLFDGALTAQGVGGVYVVDEHGQVVYASRDDAWRTSSLADREYFRIHADDPGRGLLLTGPTRGRVDREWTVILSRRIDHPDGSFAGVVAGGLHLDFMEGVFASLELDPGIGIILATTDGRLAGRRPQAGDDMGEDLRSTPLLRHFAVTPAGSFTASTPPDGTERIVVYRQVGDLPLIVAVASSTRAINAGWLRSAEVFGLVLTLLGGVELLLGRALLCELRNRERAERAATLARAEAERLSAELSWSLARHEALVNNSADAMIVARVDRLGRFTYEAVNPVWETLTGVRAATAIGRSPRDCLPGAAAELVSAAWEECVCRRGAVAFSVASMQLGERCWDAVVCPVIEADGSIERVIATARDVTEQRRLEAELREVNRMEAVGGLTAGIAHDFNNLLQAMLGALEVVSDGDGLDEHRSAAIAVAAEAGQRAASLVHQLLAFSRKQVLAPVPLVPGQIAADLSMAMRPMLGSVHRLLTDVAADAGPLLADTVQLHRCLTDLILNARDAMPLGGTLCLRIRTGEAEEAEAAGLGQGSYVRLVVEDEGVGMPDELLSRVFEPFFTTKDIGKGTGLGLSMVQGFARQSGGEVTIESAPGVGTAVSLWLPRAPERLHAAAPRAAGLGAGSSSGQSGRRVLLVDDEPAVRQTLALMLRKAGHTAVSADDGEAALALLAEDDLFDLLVTDQSMPGMTGTDLIEAVARLRPSLPAILITGYDRVKGIERIAGSVPMLTKPFQRAVFLRHVEALLAAERTLVEAA